MIAAPVSARPMTGPTTTPAIQALEAPPLALCVTLGAVSAVETG
jgi:hypothetical protein